MGEMRDVPLYKQWTMPALTANGTLGEDSYAAGASGTVTSGYDAYKSFDGKRGGAKTYCGIANVTTGSLTFYSPVKLKVTSLLFQNPSTLTANTANRFPVTFEIFGSNDGTEWSSLFSGNYESTTKNAEQTVIIPEDKYDATNVGYKYFKISAENNGGTNMDFPEITIYGQEFVRTKQESTGYIRVINAAEYEIEIDEYNFCGAFVIDDVEKTVTLPNYQNAFLMNTNATASNNGTAISAGLPNISGQVSQNEWFGGFDAGTGAFISSVSRNVDTNDDHLDARGFKTLTFDASNYNPIYGNSNTVQPPAICVVYCIQVDK